MRHAAALVLAVTAACADDPEAQAALTLVSSTPPLGVALDGARDIEITFDYEILPTGLRYGGIRDDSVVFDATGKISWADGSTGNSRPLLRESTELRLGSEVRGEDLRWVYLADDLGALMALAETPKLDDRGEVIPVVRVELVGGLRWAYGCGAGEEVGTSSCPVNLGHYEPLGELVF
jgi:hypothetical protein